MSGGFSKWAHCDALNVLTRLFLAVLCAAVSQFDPEAMALFAKFKQETALKKSTGGTPPASSALSSALAVSGPALGGGGGAVFTAVSASLSVAVAVAGAGAGAFVSAV
jgi:acid phosphatase family membrane protein YuiD